MFMHSDLEMACVFVHSSVLLVRGVIFISLQFPHAIRLAYMKNIQDLSASCFVVHL